MDSDSTLKQQIDSLVAQGWKPVGNCWVNNGSGGGRHEFCLRLNGEVKSIPVDRPFVWVPPPRSDPEHYQLGLPF